jgi:hypothetical protein
VARARNIKPGFFTNEVLGVLDPIIGLTFIGLWCLADKEGRLEDRPLRIKAELFPYRYPLDVNGDLTVLEREGFIDRYEVDGVGYIQVVNFHKHQSPHHTEKAKGYPQKPLQRKEKQTLTVKQPLDNGEYQVRTRSDSLIPDSLIPDSLIEDSKTIRASRFDARAHLSSLGVPSQIAMDWIAHRKAKKATPTRTAIDGIAMEAGKAGIPLSEALSLCCQRGWVGFKAEWIAKDQQVPVRPINGRQAAISNYAAQAAEARAKHEFSIVERDITGEAIRVA